MSGVKDTFLGRSAEKERAGSMAKAILGASDTR